MWRARHTGKNVEQVALHLSYISPKSHYIIPSQKYNFYQILTGPSKDISVPGTAIQERVSRGRTLVEGYYPLSPCFIIFLSTLACFRADFLFHARHPLWQRQRQRQLKH